MAEHYFSQNGLAACCTGWLVGPALTGLYDTILRALRDEPGFWWHTYKRVWKQSFKSSFLPGMIFTVLWALVGYAAFALPLMADVSTSFAWILLLDVSFFINLYSPFCKNGRPDRGGHFCNGGIFSARTRRG